MLKRLLQASRNGISTIMHAECLRTNSKNMAYIFYGVGNLGIGKGPSYGVDNLLSSTKHLSLHFHSLLDTRLQSCS